MNAISNKQKILVVLTALVAALASHGLVSSLATDNGLVGYGVVALMAVALSSVFVMVFFRFGNQASSSFVNQLRGIAEGKQPLDTPINVTDDKAGQEIAAYYNKVVDGFGQSMKELKVTTNDLAFIASRMSEVTERTETNTLHQQNETDLVATAMNEMSATVDEVAQNTGLAAESASAADQAASKGVEIAIQTKKDIDELVSDVDNASEVISKLEAESQNIGVVLDVIKSIAEQTNLLALNAAIEAARAGEQGRGFAVVADEVRTLASRTHTSTKEIEEMIIRLQGGVNDSVSVMQVALDKGKQGSKQVDSTLEALNEIMDAVSRINDMNSQIATAAEEQSQVANEINRNIVNISQVATQTTQDAKESRETSVKLAGISMRFSDMLKHVEHSDSQSLDLSSAKAAHLNWKTRLRDFLDGKEALSVEQAVSHKHCDFGKWYYSEGLRKFGHLEPIAEVEKPHEELHKLIKTIVELKNEGNIQEAEEAYKHVASLSEDIVGCLTQAEQQSGS